MGGGIVALFFWIFMGSFKDKVDKLLGVAIPLFGEQVEYRFKDGGCKKIRGVFDDDFELVDPDTETVISSNASRLGIRLRDLPRLPKQRDEILIGGKLYEVRDSQEDGQGGTSLILNLVE